MMLEVSRGMLMDEIRWEGLRFSRRRLGTLSVENVGDVPEGIYVEALGRARQDVVG